MWTNDAFRLPEGFAAQPFSQACRSCDALGKANAPHFQAFLALRAFDKHLLSLHQHAEP